MGNHDMRRVLRVSGLRRRCRRRAARGIAMENAQRIINVSSKLRKICIGLIFCLPILSVLFWVDFNRLYAMMGQMIPLPVRLDHELTVRTRFFAFLTNMPPLGVSIYGLLKLKELFRLYEKGFIFTKENVDCFRSFGRTLIVWVACDVASNTLLSIALTIDNPPGRRVIAVGLNSGEFAGMFVGAVVLIISWVMDEGRKIQEEQALII